MFHKNEAPKPRYFTKTQRLNFRMGWRETPALKKSCFSGIFGLYETELPVFEKFADFPVMLENFLVSVAVSYSRSKALVFRFYQELNAVQYENSELSCGILRIFPVFDEVVYLRKTIVDLIYE